MKQACIAIITLSLILSACGSDKEPQGNPVPNSTAAPSPSTVITNVPSASPATPSPSSSPQLKQIKKDYHMNPNYDIVPNDPNGNKKIVLLTFDDGPKDKDMNTALINTLDKHNAKAIFFLNGYRIKEKPELVKLIHDRGQIIGNHSWDHINLKKEASEKVDRQILEVQQIVRDLTDEAPQFFRPPFGAGSDYVKSKVKAEKMLYMTWSNGSLDWEMTNKNHDSQKVISNVLSQLHSGSNILMHELPWTVEALDSLLTQLEEKGYTFVDPRAIELETK
jgi:peptidoglycan-N-acetylglucosamine deacetylase